MNKYLKIRGKIPKKSYLMLIAITFGGLFIIWTAISAAQIVPKTFLPSPMDVVNAFISEVQSGQLWSDMEISCYRIFMGFFIAVIIGVPLGILAGTFQAAEAIIRPMSEFIRYMPVPSFVPLIMIWVGIGESAKMDVILIGTLFQLIPVVADDVRSIPDDLLNASYTLGANRKQAIFKVLLPCSMPKIMETMRLMLGLAWTYLVTAELVAANTGLGYSILKAQRFLQTDVIFCGILVIGFLGLIFDRTFALLNKKLFPWYEGGA